MHANISSLHIFLFPSLPLSISLCPSPLPLCFSSSSLFHVPNPISPYFSIPPIHSLTPTLLPHLTPFSLSTLLFSHSLPYTSLPLSPAPHSAALYCDNNIEIEHPASLEPIHNNNTGLWGLSVSFFIQEALRLTKFLYLDEGRNFTFTIEDDGGKVLWTDAVALQVCVCVCVCVCLCLYHPLILIPTKTALPTLLAHPTLLTQPTPQGLAPHITSTPYIDMYYAPMYMFYYI